ELKAAGIENLKPLNVSRWRCNGYQKWVRREERLEEMRAQQEFALELAAQNDNSLQRASVAMAASQIYEAVEGFDIRKLQSKLKRKPELYGLLIETISK